MLRRWLVSSCLTLPIAMPTATAQRAPQEAEWTLDAAQACWRPMVRPVQHVGFPGYPFQAGVLWDGSVVLGPTGFRELGVMQRELAPLGDNGLHLSVAYGEPMHFSDRMGRADARLARGLDSGRLPLPWIETRDESLVWRETAFAHILGRRPDSGLSQDAGDVLVVHVRFRVDNGEAHPRTARLWLHFGNLSQVHLGYKCAVGPDLSAPLPLRFAAPFGERAGDGATVRYIVPQPRVGSVRQYEHGPVPMGAAVPADGAIEWEAPLAPHGTAELEVRIPYGYVSEDTAARILAVDADEALEQVRDFWRDLISRRGAIITPDPFVNDYLAAIAGQMAEQVAYRRQTDLWMYKTSPNHYEGYWPCNAAKALPTLDFRGLEQLTVPVLGSFVTTQTDDPGALGAERRPGRESSSVGGEGFSRRPGFLGNFGEWTANTLLLSHGLEMWALASHYRITRDAAWLGSGPGSPLQAILDACDWTAEQRRRTMREEDGRPVAHYGLLPAASAHDWLSGNAVFNDAFCIYGLAESVRLLREIGHPRAEEWAAELADYRACFRARLAEARDRARPVPMPDGTMLPYVPRDIYELDWANIDWTYTGYSPLRAGAWGALDPDDELVDQALAFVERGMPKGEGPYFSAPTANADTADRNWADISDPSAERHYLWRHYVEYETMWPIGGPLFLARDDLPRFFEWLFNNLAVVVHRDFRVGVESLDGVPSCAPGDGERWQLIRNMLINERGGYDGSQQSLWLCQAIPRSWLRPGDRITVKDMPTRFGGRVGLDVHVAEDGRAMRVEVDTDLAIAPAEARLRARAGVGSTVGEVRLDDRVVPVAEDGTIALPVGRQGHYDIHVRLDRA